MSIDTMREMLLHLSEFTKLYGLICRNTHTSTFNNYIILWLDTFLGSILSQRLSTNSTRWRINSSVNGAFSLQWRTCLTRVPCKTIVYRIHNFTTLSAFILSQAWTTLNTRASISLGIGFVPYVRTYCAFTYICGTIIYYFFIAKKKVRLYIMYIYLWEEICLM